MPRRLLRSALTALVCLSWTGLADDLWAAEALVPQLALEVGYDNNIGLAERRSDREADLIVTAVGSLRQTLTLGPRSALTLRIAAKYHEFIDFSNLNRRELGAGAHWYFQPTPGFTRPWYSLSVDWSALRHADSTIRNGALWRLGATTGRRFTDRVSGQLGYGYANRSARRGEVFDLEQHRLFSSLEWRLQGGATLYGNYSVMQGDIVSSARPNGTIIGAADAVAPDAAFGGDAVTAGTGMGPGPGVGNSGFVAYQLDATVRRLELGMNLPIDSLTALDVGIARLDATATSSIDYNGVQWRAGVLRRY